MVYVGVKEKKEWKWLMSSLSYPHKMWLYMWVLFTWITSSEEDFLTFFLCMRGALCKLSWNYPTIILVILQITDLYHPSVPLLSAHLYLCTWDFWCASSLAVLIYIEWWTMGQSSYLIKIWYSFHNGLTSDTHIHRYLLLLFGDEKRNVNSLAFW